MQKGDQSVVQYGMQMRVAAHFAVPLPGTVICDAFLKGLRPELMCMRQTTDQGEVWEELNKLIACAQANNKQFPRPLVYSASVAYGKQGHTPRGVGRFQLYVRPECTRQFSGCSFLNDAQGRGRAPAERAEQQPPRYNSLRPNQYARCRGFLQVIARRGTMARQPMRQPGSSRAWPMEMQRAGLGPPSPNGCE